MNSSFLERDIQVSLNLNGDSFDNAGNNVLTLSGLRCQVTVQTYGGSTGSFASQAQLRISGLKNNDMAKLSTLGFAMGSYRKNAISISAGDTVNGMANIFQGGIIYGNVDYNSMPDVGLEIVASALSNIQYDRPQASSWKGKASVDSMLKQIAQNAGLQYQNNGVTASLSDQAVTGSTENQIDTICHAAGISRAISNGTLYIWPSGSVRDDMVVNVSPQSGLVGYPRYIVAGVEITTLFNPTFEVGRQVFLQSSTPNPDAAQASNFPLAIQHQNGQIVAAGANGKLYCFGVTHNLSSQTFDGPWFSDVRLSDTIFNARDV